MIYQDAPYYLAPDGKMAEETFIVLREAMREADKLAIARLVLSSRERVVTIGARDKGMFVCTLRGPNEVRATSTYFDEIPDAKPDAEMLQLAEALIAQKTAKFDPKAYEDRYETALMAMIKEKLKGHKPIIAAEPQRGNVVNLMDALKQSLGQAEARGAEQEQGAGGGAPEEKPAAKAAAGGRRAGPRPSRDARSPARASASSARLPALPRRIAAREVAARGGELRRGVDAADRAGRLRAARCSPAATTPRSRRGSRRRAAAGGSCAARTASCACSPGRGGGAGAWTRQAVLEQSRAGGAATSSCWRSSTPSSTTSSPSRSAT